LSENLTTDWSKAEIRARNLDIQLKEEIRNHKEHVEELKENFRKHEEELLNKQTKINERFDDFKKHMKREYDIKDALLKKYVMYSEELQKELVVTKNVVKNPDTMRCALRTLNYTDLQLYRYKHSESKELLNPRIPQLEHSRRASLDTSVVQKVLKFLIFSVPQPNSQSPK
jgi:predicted transcriptional regulator